MKPKHEEHLFRLTAQQAKVRNLPVFGGFPYLATHVVPALFHLFLLPRSFQPELLLQITRQQVATNQLPACLVFGAGDCLYCKIDGTEFRSGEIPWGGHTTFGQLRLCAEFENDDELQVRHRFLAAYVDSRTRAGVFIHGDLTKGGRDASPDEQLRLAGVQTGGSPRGLSQCPTCGEFKGRVMRVHCVCENHNRCAACGDLLDARKLNANYFEKSDGQIWHVPGYCGFAHNCE
jgi:hypothetical protein